MATEGPSDGAQAFLTAFLARDFDAVRATLAPNVQFRFATPSKVREVVGPDEVMRYLTLWFGAGEQRQVESGIVATPPGRSRVWYNLEVRPQPVTKDPRWHRIEQQVYVPTGPGPIKSLGLLCTGFMPVG